MKLEPKVHYLQANIFTSIFGEFIWAAPLFGRLKRPIKVVMQPKTAEKKSSPGNCSRQASPTVRRYPDARSPLNTTVEKGCVRKQCSLYLADLLIKSLPTLELYNGGIMPQLYFVTIQ